MSDTVIRVENLGKKYVLGRKQEGERYTALRDVIANGAKGAISRLRNPRSKSQESELDEFWALKDVSFEIKRGDRVGIVGRNGAGKSTLLKILSRITEPTEGRISIKGRVASLLEVGTGFHPELTGRENIFLNGAILGMSKTEISHKFDEIVSFSEIERFLDTPVKRYSSGMYVKLAFSVAAHLEPETLIVDEVLAVGDYQFQKKCLGKMEDVAKNEGRTVLFVSHNMAAVKALCNKSVVLKQGNISFVGDAQSGIERYLLDSEFAADIPIRERKRHKGPNGGATLTKKAEICDVRIFNRNSTSSIIDSQEPVDIHLDIESTRDFRSGLYIVIQRDDLDILWFDSGHLKNQLFQLKMGQNKFRCSLKYLNLTSGYYRISCGITIPNQEWVDYVSNALSFSIDNFDPNGTGFNYSRKFGVTYVEHEWMHKTSLYTSNSSVAKEV